MTDEKVLYRFGKDGTYRQAATKRKVVSKTELVVTAEIPPAAESDGDVLQYYYQIKFDGQLNSDGSSEKPHEVPIRGKSAVVTNQHRDH